MRENVRANRLRVARNVRRLRALRGLSQAALAERVGNSEKHVGQVERAEVNVGLDVLSRIAVALAVDLAELFAQPPRRLRSESDLLFITQRQLDVVHGVIEEVRGTRKRPKR